MANKSSVARRNKKKTHCYCGVLTSAQGPKKRKKESASHFSIMTSVPAVLGKRPADQISDVEAEKIALDLYLASRREVRRRKQILCWRCVGNGLILWIESFY